MFAIFRTLAVRLEFPVVTVESPLVLAFDLLSPVLELSTSELSIDALLNCAVFELSELLTLVVLLDPAPLLLLAIVVPPLPQVAQEPSIAD